MIIHAPSHRNHTTNRTLPKTFLTTLLHKSPAQVSFSLIFYSKSTMLNPVS